MTRRQRSRLSAAAEEKSIAADQQRAHLIRIVSRLVTTYAGFEGESELLAEMHKRGLVQPLVGPDLRAGDGILMFWSHEPIAPWQDEKWLADMRRSLRPNQYLRMIENRFVTTESTFIEMGWWDACVDPNAHPLLGGPVAAGVARR